MKRLAAILTIVTAVLTSLPSYAQRTQLMQEDISYVNPLRYGLSLNATTLNAAITAIGSVNKRTLFLSTGSWSFTTNVTVPSNITLLVPAGTTVSINSGVTLTLNGPLKSDNPLWYTGAGTLVLNHHDWSVDTATSFIVSDCNPAVPASSLTLAAFACRSNILSNSLWAHVNQAAAAVGPLNGSDGTYWLALHRDNTTAITGWTRQTETNYLWQLSATEPATPPGGIIFQQVIVSGSVITNVLSRGNRCGGIPQGTKVFNVVCYGADTAGAVDSGSAIIAASTALQAAGSGTLLFPPGTYKLYTVGTTYAQLASFTNLTGVSILGHGAVLAIDSTRVFTASYATMFILSGCISSIVDGFTVTGPVMDITQTTVKGVEFVRCQQGCNGLSMPYNKLQGVLAGLIVARLVTDPLSYISKNINIGTLDVTGAWYGINCQYSCEDMQVDLLITSAIHRSFFVYGAKRVKVTIHSTNPASLDVLLSIPSGIGLEDLTIHYTNKASTLATSLGYALIQLNYAGPTPGYAFNIDVKLEVAYQAGNNLGPAFEIQKADAAGNPDLTDRGHLLRNLRLSGNISGTQGAAINGAISTNEGNGYTWGTTLDSWYNIIWENLYLDAVASPYFSLAALKKNFLLSNVYSTVILRLRNISTGYNSTGTYRVQNSWFPNQHTASGGGNSVDVINPNSGPPLTVSVGWTGHTITGIVGGGDMTWVLPPANIGLEYTFVRQDIGNQFIDPNAAETIRGCAAGKQYYLGAQGSAVTLRCHITGFWDVVSVTGVSSCEP